MIDHDCKFTACPHQASSFTYWSPYPLPYCPDITELPPEQERTFYQAVKGTMPNE